MLIAAIISALLAVVVLVEIESWRRRTSAACMHEARRRASREDAWAAVAALEPARERRAA